MKPMPLPWHGAHVPHVLLDVLRGCDVRCRDCYNTDPPALKGLAEVEAELASALARRRLTTVSLIGGEPLLHPDLEAITARIKDRGLSVQIFTNGLALTEARARSLKAAGADFLMLHVEAGQQRPDLDPADPGALRRLREAKAAVARGAGLEAGLSITAWPGDMHEVDEAVDTVVRCPDLVFGLVTVHLDAQNFPRLVGDLETGFRSVDGPPGPELAASLAARRAHGEALRARLDTLLGPAFAVLEAQGRPGDERWASYLVATADAPDGAHEALPLRTSRLEPAFQAVLHRLGGRYPFFQAQDDRRNRTHLLANGLAGGGLRRALGFLGRARGAQVQVKRILLQAPATLDEQGHLVHCRDCPDAVVRQGRLVPVCITDRVLGPGCR